MIESWLLGAAVGGVGGIPVGPLGALALEQSLAHKTRAALGTGFGAALGMGVYGYVAVVLLDSVQGRIEANAAALQTGVGALFVWLAWGAWRRLSAAAARDSFLAATLHAGLLAALRPTTCLVVAGLVSSLFPGRLVDPPAAFAVGGFTANFLWFVVLALAGRVLRERVSAQALHVLRLALVVLIAGFGLAFLFKGVFALMAA